MLMVPVFTYYYKKLKFMIKSFSGQIVIYLSIRRAITVTLEIRLSQSI